MNVMLLGWIWLNAFPWQDLVYGMTPARSLSLVAGALGVLSLVLAIATRARKTAKIGAGTGRKGAVAGLACAVVAASLGAYLFAVATGGPGSGSGVVGAGVALALGLLGAVVNGLALRRLPHPNA